MKIFLISSSYIEMSMAEVLDAFFNEKIEKLFLLYENHPKRKYHFHNSDYSVEFVKNIEEGIKKSDIILVVKDSALSPNFVYNLNKKCIQYGKLLLNGAIIKRRCTDFHDKYKDIIDTYLNEDNIRVKLTQNPSKNNLFDIYSDKSPILKKTEYGYQRKGEENIYWIRLFEDPVNFDNEPEDIDDKPIMF